MGWESAKPSEGCSIVKGFGKPDVGQVMPNRDGHGLEQGQRGPPGLTLARRWKTAYVQTYPRKGLLNAGSDVIAIGFASPGDAKPICPLISDFQAIEFRLN